MVLLIENFIFVIVPSILWFYYFFSGNECNSPMDDIILTICILYSIIILCYIIYAIINIFKFNLEEENIKYVITHIYLIPVSILLIIIQIKVQMNYCNNWENNTCNNLKGFILAWLIINYFQTFLHLLVYASYCSSCFHMCQFFSSEEGKRIIYDRR